jgi:hypothetical protein
VIRDRYVVQYDNRAFAVSLRFSNCPGTCAPSDTASGTLSAEAAESLFNLVLQQSPFSLKDDYGHDPTVADDLSYTFVITASGLVKTIHADGHTMPLQLHQIEQAVREKLSFFTAQRWWMVPVAAAAYTTRCSFILTHCDDRPATTGSEIVFESQARERRLWFRASPRARRVRAPRRRKGSSRHTAVRMSWPGTLPRRA